jgi:hypothetical protein
MLIGSSSEDIRLSGEFEIVEGAELESNLSNKPNRK